MKGYITLATAIIGEIFGTSMLKLSEGFTKLLPSLGFIVGMGIAFYALSLCLNYLPLGTAYAIWSGVGTAATALIGLLVFHEPFNVLMIVGIILIIGGVVFLNTSKGVSQAVDS